MVFLKAGLMGLTSSKLGVTLSTTLVSCKDFTEEYFELFGEIGKAGGMIGVGAGSEANIRYFTGSGTYTKFAISGSGAGGFKSVVLAVLALLTAGLALGATVVTTGTEGANSGFASEVLLLGAGVTGDSFELSFRLSIVTRLL